jgi:hypothetical protein
MDHLEDDLHVLADFVLDLLLLVSGPATNQHVLSPARVQRLERAKVLPLTTSTRIDVQLGAIHFLKHQVCLHETEIAPWAILMAVGATTDFHVLHTFCREELHRMHQYHSSALDTPTVMSFLLNMLLGKQQHVNHNDGAHETGRRMLMLVDRELPEAVVRYVMPLLLMSKAAANAFPMNLQVICKWLFGPISSLALVLEDSIARDLSLSIYLSLYLSLYLSIYVSIYVYIYLSI